MLHELFDIDNSEDNKLSGELNNRSVSAVVTLHCEQCQEPLSPRTGTGGKPQRFCSDNCRKAFRRSQPDTNSQPDSQPDTNYSQPERFDWRRSETLLRPVAMTCAYLDDNGDLLIGQDGYIGQTDDRVIKIPAEHIEAFILGLTDILGMSLK